MSRRDTQDVGPWPPNQTECARSEEHVRNQNMTMATNSEHKIGGVGDRVRHRLTLQRWASKRHGLPAAEADARFQLHTDLRTEIPGERASEGVVRKERLAGLPDVNSAPPAGNAPSSARAGVGTS